MLNLMFLMIERLAISLVVGGGIVMAACVRPLMLKILAHREHSELRVTVEGLSIGAWNAYNRFAFIATVALMMLEAVRVVCGLQSTYWHLGLTILMFIILLAKFAIDKKLKSRLQQSGGAAVGSREQQMGHRQVELLSILLLIAAILFAVLPE